MRSLIRPLLLAALLLSPAPSLFAQAAVDPSGHWEGTIQVPGREVNVEIDLARNGKGDLAGTTTIPAQHLMGLPLANLAVKGTLVSFQVKGSAPGDRAYNGALSSDGKSMSGEFTQSGYSIPFSLTRTGEARIEARIRNAPIGKELEGTWNGTLNAGGRQMRVVLTMSNQPDGTATASFVNVDEGLEIPVAAITQKASSVTLEVKAVGGSYTGSLSPDGTELAGTLTEGSAVLPLTFRHAKP